MKSVLKNLRRWATGVTKETHEAVNADTQRQLNFFGVLSIIIPFLTSLVIGIAAYAILGNLTLALGIFSLLVVTGLLVERVYTERRQGGNSGWGRTFRALSVVLTFSLMCIFLEPVIFRQDIKNETLRRFRNDNEKKALAVLEEVKPDREELLRIDEQRAANSERIKELLRKAGGEMTAGTQSGKIGEGRQYTANLRHIQREKTQMTADSMRLYEKATHHALTIDQAEHEADSLRTAELNFGTITLADQLDVLKDFVIEDKRYSVILLLIAFFFFSVVVELLPIMYRSVFMNEAEIERVNNMFAKRRVMDQDRDTQNRTVQITESVRSDIARITAEIDVEVFNTELSKQVTNLKAATGNATEQMIIVLDSLADTARSYQDRQPQIPAEAQESGKHAYITALTKIHEAIDGDFGAEESEPEDMNV